MTTDHERQRRAEDLQRRHDFVQAEVAEQDSRNRPEGADSRAWKTQMLAFMNLRFQGK